MLGIVSNWLSVFQGLSLPTFPILFERMTDTSFSREISLLIRIVIAIYEAETLSVSVCVRAFHYLSKLVSFFLSTDDTLD